MTITDYGYSKRSETLMRRRDQEANRVLLSILSEFGRRFFSMQDVIDSLGFLTTSQTSEKWNKDIHAALQNLKRRQLLVVAYADKFEISEKGHQLANALEAKDEEEAPVED